MKYPSIHELDRLNNYQTDKLGRCPVNRHDYGEAIDFHFNKFRDTKIVLWEVGVDRGDSLRMWSDYFPLATVVGIDIRLPTLPGYQLPPRTIFTQGNATDPKLISELVLQYPPDVVIDDGSHKASDMHRVFDLIWPHTKLIYCVEDLGTQYESKHGHQFLDAEPFTNRVKVLCDELAKMEHNTKRVCWEPGQVYIYR